MALDFLLSEFADFCPVCKETAMLCRRDSDLNESICEDCAANLAQVEDTLLELDLDRPSPALIRHHA